MRDPVESTERIYFKLVASALGSALLLALIIWGGWRGWQSWQERRYVRQATTLLDAGDFKGAAVNARQALELNGANVETARLLAKIGEKAGDGSELAYRRQVAALRPDSVADGLALARCALATRNVLTAERTLQGLEKIATGNPEYHAMCARLAEMRSTGAEAEAQWARALELAPGEAAYQLELAILQLRAAEATKRQAARELLERLRADPKQRAAATRALLAESGGRDEDAPRRRELARELQEDPAATFSDRLLYLAALQRPPDPAYAEYLAKVEREAVADAANCASVISWLDAHGEGVEALRFAGTLPMELAEKWPVPAAVAEAHARVQDWAGLRRIASGHDWGGFDFLRHAYLTRALRGLEQNIAAEQEWKNAQKKAAGEPGALLTLARTAADWGWEKETADLLWELSKADETRAEALQRLHVLYEKGADTAGLYRVLVREVEVSPEDRRLQREFARVSLLLEADPERARKIATALVRKEPGEASYVATYAFALFTRGDTEAAVQALAKLSEAQLEDPAIAAYYGIVLAGAGKKEQSRPYLERGAAAVLLPEEKRLLAKAQGTLP